MHDGLGGVTAQIALLASAGRGTTTSEAPGASETLRHLDELALMGHRELRTLMNYLESGSAYWAISSANCNPRKSPLTPPGRRTILRPMVRLAIVEDDPTFLALPGQVIAGEADFQLAGLHASAEAAIAATDWNVVDVRLTDLGLPDLSGVGLIARATLDNPRLLALAYTIHDDRETVFAALRAGAFGYVIKGGSSDDLLDAIRRVAHGESPMSPPVARYLFDNFRRDPPQSSR